MPNLTEREVARNRYDLARDEFKGQETARKAQYDQLREKFSAKKTTRRKQLDSARVEFEKKMDSIAERYSFMRRTLNEAIIKAPSQNAREEKQGELRVLTDRYHQMQEVLETKWRDQRKLFEQERESDMANWDRVESHFLLVRKAMEDKMGKEQEIYWETTDE